MKTLAILIPMLNLLFGPGWLPRLWNWWQEKLTNAPTPHPDPDESSTLLKDPEDPE